MGTVTQPLLDAVDHLCYQVDGDPEIAQEFFGKRNQTTLQKFDSLSTKLRRSRTGTLDFLINHYEWFQNNRSEVIR
jgi:hypothetical protein